MCEIAFIKTKGKELQLLINDETLEKNSVCEGKIGKLVLKSSTEHENLEQSEVSHMAEGQTGWCPQKEDSGKALRKRSGGRRVLSY